MKALVVAIALVGAGWGCDAKASPTVVAPMGALPSQTVAQEKTAGASYTATVKIDDV